MKVVLFALNGSFSHSNLAIRCLRPGLEEDGFEVILAENNLRDRTSHILERLYQFKADIYGFSCYIWNLEETLKIARTLHDILPESHIILGGPEVSFATERFDGENWIDAIVTGEGEEAMRILCRQIRDGEAHPRIVMGTPADMEAMGMLYRPLETNARILYYESSRGCPYACSYCLSSTTRGVRLKSVEKTLADLQEFERLESDFQIIKFVDRTFNADPHRANVIWKALLEARFTKKYHFEVCATLLNEESFEILSQFPKGKIQLEFGLQSTNKKTLLASARHIHPQTVIEAVKRVHSFGNIHVHLDLIAGLPYEDYGSFANSFDQAYGSCDMLQLGFLKLLYGTELRNRKEEYGYQCLSYPPYTILQTKWMSYAELQRLSRIAEVLDRYLESGRFAHTLWYLTPLLASPFRFWEGLCDFIQAKDSRPLQRISQPDAFRYLLEYAQERVACADPALLKKMLCADFSMHEHKNPPAFLRDGL